MTATDDILGQLPIQQLAAQLGTDPAEVERASAQIIPALIAGMSANADDAGGERSLAGALRQHASSPVLGDGVALDQVDTGDGQAIVHQVFGPNTDAVAQRLGSQAVGGNNALVEKLLPILAPIVLAYLAKNLAGGKYGDILGPILGSLGAGSAGGQQAPRGGGLQDILLDMLGGAMGGGSMGGGAADQRGPQSPAPAPQAPAPQAPAPQAPAPQAPQNNGPFNVPASGGDDRAPDQIPLDTPQSAPQQQAPQQQAPQQGGGGLLGEILGGLLGGGRRS